MNSTLVFGVKPANVELNQMPARLKSFLKRWMVNTLAVALTVYVLRNRIHYDRPVDLLMASLLLGVLNVYLRPLLMLLSLPLLIFTLGLFTLVINAFLLYFVGWVLQPRFHVDGFASAFWGALVISIISLILNSLTGSGNSRLVVRRGKPSSPPKDGDGPVIDV